MRTLTKTLGTGLLAVAAVVGALTVPAAAASAATPGTGFSYGTDSWPVAGTGSAPFTEPVTGVTVSLESSLLSETKLLQRRVKKRKVKQLTLRFRLTNAKGAAIALTRKLSA